MNHIKISYWCPFISKVATIKAVVNSVDSLVKYSKNSIKPEMINVFGEWNNYKKELIKKKISFSNQMIKNDLLHIKISSFVASRLKYFFIFFFCLIPLMRYLKNSKSEFFIVHLVTSLPLFIFIFFNFKTKLILRVSGLPKLNFHRKLLWRISSKKIYKITCPTLETYQRLSQYPYLRDKLYLLRDPIISVAEILKKRKEKLNISLPKKDFILSIGRLTKQKNFIFLIKNFAKLNTKELDLVILGEGEDKRKMQKLINDLKLKQKVHLINFTDNVFNLLKKCKYFISTSLWEDPGFVLIEAAYMNKTILSSDCPSGPKEILSNGDGGYLFKSLDDENFKTQYNFMINADNNSLKKKQIIAKKKIKEFSMFRHYNNLKKILVL